MNNDRFPRGSNNWEWRGRGPPRSGFDRGGRRGGFWGPARGGFMPGPHGGPGGFRHPGPRDFRDGNRGFRDNPQWKKPKRETPAKRLSEEEIAVTHYISDHKGFNGIIKSRYVLVVINVNFVTSFEFIFCNSRLH